MIQSLIYELDRSEGGTSLRAIVQQTHFRHVGPMQEEVPLDLYVRLTRRCTHLMLDRRKENHMSTSLIVLLVLIVLGGGGWGYTRWRR